MGRGNYCECVQPQIIELFVTRTTVACYNEHTASLKLIDLANSNKFSFRPQYTVYIGENSEPITENYFVKNSTTM